MPEGRGVAGTRVLVRDLPGHAGARARSRSRGAREGDRCERGTDPAPTRSFDLLWKGVELTTGAQREHRHPVLVRQAAEKGLRPESLQFYLDFFRYGCPPHGGFGFGPARMLMVLLGRQSIKDVTYLFRGPARLYP